MHGEIVRNLSPGQGEKRGRSIFKQRAVAIWNALLKMMEAGNVISLPGDRLCKKHLDKHLNCQGTEGNEQCAATWD